MKMEKLAAALLLGAAAAVPARIHAQVRPDTSHAAHAHPPPDTAQGAMHHPIPADTTSHAGMHHPMPADTARGAHAGHDMGAMPGMAMPGMKMPGDTLPTPLQHAGLHDAMSGRRHAGMKHEMLMRPLGGGWQLLGMAQAFAMTTWAAPRDAGSPLHATESYLTQPAVMVNVLGPGARLALRTTLNLEAVSRRARSPGAGGARDTSTGGTRTPSCTRRWPASTCGTWRGAPSPSPPGRGSRRTGPTTPCRARWRSIPPTTTFRRSWSAGR